MPVINKGTALSNGEQLTAEKLNNLLDLATFSQTATDSVSTFVNSSGQIAVLDGGIATVKLASGAVTETKVLDGSITTAKLASGAVTETKVLDGSITPAKLSTGAPSWDASSHLIVAGNVTGDSDTGSTSIYGGTQGNGANIELYGGSHASRANHAYYDADVHKFRLQDETESMRINNSGNVGIGTTSPLSLLHVGGLTRLNSTVTAVTATTSAIASTLAAANTGAVSFESVAGSTATRHHISFVNPNGVVGSVSTNASATAYNTSSDYRLKEDIVDIADSIERLKQLKPCNFAWKLDGTRVDGFIAHEAQEVVPEAVHGTKDALDKDGNPEYQGIDQSKLIPLLTKALQEAISKIESLESRIAALEA
jgi:hypothetical protein